MIWGRLGAVVVAGGLMAGCTGTGDPSDGSIVVGGGFLGSAFREQPLRQSEADLALADLLKTDAGQALSDADRRAAATALRNALVANRTGETVDWSNRSSGVRGRVIAGPNYQVNNILCRDYTHVLLLKDGERSMRGSACRGQGGGWQPIT
ncbi:hypothetical protein H1W37_04695 [Stappia taiwanensis]|uniref:Surface antigen domain-containing protein n=1 Tax=Stappia taiwanensis TaxID=992267 RepID=A0A838XM77_9HYPH|nr:RT0821/Lpp0805 family surface protein [Stappia taiwanensis]MBA4610937.1 hypothetical protein [Stappia taiwanensis]GGE94691.1 hypothetical protein GCM10007285_22920 [Stappia taiwanensis]